MERIENFYEWGIHADPQNSVTEIDSLVQLRKEVWARDEIRLATVRKELDRIKTGI